jgi:tetratricopeptide (TPR) repeat protein
MPIIIIALKDILVAPVRSVDLASIPEGEAIDLIKKTYGFLSEVVEVEIRDGIARITFPEENATKSAQAIKEYERGVKRAERGEYKKAIELFKRTLSVLPNHTKARRNLSMAYLEDGNLEEARNQLMDLLRVDPKDVWGYLLLGNTYSKYENDFDSAEPFYKKAYEVNPKDPYLLTNYAVLMLETDRTEEAIRMFDQAISAAPKYPNSYLGLAHFYLRESRLDLVLSTLDRLFDESDSSDIRSKPVYEQARQLYLDANKVKAQQVHTSVMEFIRERQKHLEIKTGYPIEIAQDDTLKMVAARTQMAWKHARDHHRIAYKKNRPEIIPHLLVHELEHTSLEQEARESGKNKIFISTAANREASVPICLRHHRVLI